MVDSASVCQRTAPGPGLVILPTIIPDMRPKGWSFYPPPSATVVQPAPAGILHRMEQPSSTQPLPEAQTEPPDAVSTPVSGASDATLIIFLGGVMLLLAMCVGFILVAS